MTETHREAEPEPETESETRAQITGLIAEGVGDPAMLVLLRAVQEMLLKMDAFEMKLNALDEDINSRRQWELDMKNLHMLDLMERRAWEVMTGRSGRTTREGSGTR